MNKKMLKRVLAFVLMAAVMVGLVFSAAKIIMTSTISVPSWHGGRRCIAG